MTPPRSPVFLIVTSVVALLLIAVLGFAAKTPGWTAADLRVDEAVQSVRRPWLTAIALALNYAFMPVAGFCVIALLVLTLLALHRASTALLVTLVITLGWTMSSFYKALVARPRPPASHQLIPEMGNDSFPSGHVALTLSLAIAAGLLAAGTRHFRLVAALGAALVIAQALARMYLGVHYLTDVIGSILVVAAATIPIIALRERIEGPSRGGTAA